MFRIDPIDAAGLELIGLAAATVLVWLLLPDALLRNSVVLIIAALKGYTIVQDYLGLRAAPALWRGLVMTWVILITAFAGAAAAVHHVV
jgi:Prokaryotic Cytochrome C oxidase subunit IV